MEWSTSSEFFESFRVDDGVHSIALPSGQSLDLVLRGVGDLGDSAALPIFFSGAVTGRTSTLPPYFSGERISDSLGVPWIAVSDPLLGNSDNLALGWYTGRIGDGVQDLIAAVADTISEKLDREMLFVGGSGGGFASLMALALCRRPARAMVWNPQIDLRKYTSKTVHEYLSTGLGLHALVGDVATLDAPGELRWQVPRLQLDKRVLYLQNLSDWHVSKHLLDFLLTQELSDADHGVFEREAMQVFLANFGRGHAAPPKPTLETLLRELMDADVSNSSLFNLAREARLWDGTAPSTIPRLTEDASIPGFERPTIDLIVDNEGSLVKVGRPPSGMLQGVPGHVRYNVSGRDDHGNRVGSGPRSHPIIRFPEKQIVSAHATVVDGFGRRVFSERAQRTMAGSSGNDASVDLAPTSVFILGSCVSRDAFNLPGAPTVTDYIARTSLSGAFAAQPDAPMPNFNNNPSKFQRRMVETDWRKGLGLKLSALDEGVVLLDLIDERFPQIHVGGSFVTGSPELRACDESLFSSYPKDVAGSKGHLERFRVGAQALADAVSPDRVAVSKVFWAEKTEDGELLPNLDHIRAINAILRSLYEILGEYPFRWIEYSPEDIVASLNHRWGVAPYHFVDRLYERTLASLSTVFVDACEV